MKDESDIRLCYLESGNEVRLGDYVEFVRRLRPNLPGEVCHIPGMEDPYGVFGEIPDRDWAIRVHDGTVFSIPYSFIMGIMQSPHSVRFVERGDARPFDAQFDARPIQLPSPLADVQVNVDKMLTLMARNRLVDIRMNAKAFFDSHPGVDLIELARALGGKQGKLGVLAVLLEEVQDERDLLFTIKDLLIREINQKMPQGWSVEGVRNQSVLFVSWPADLYRFLDDPILYRSTIRIVDDLALNSPPSMGWRPSLPGDPYIDGLFERHWCTN